MNPTISFNGYLSTNFCVLLNEIGVFDLFDNDTYSTTKENIDNLLIKIDNTLSFEYILKFAMRFSIFNQDGSSDTYRLSEEGIHWLKERAFAVWLVGGYGKYLLDKCLLKDEKSIDSVDGKYVALGSQMANRSYMQDVYINSLIKYQPNNIVDLGCGGGSRLIEACRVVDNLTGVGIDLSKAAINSAIKNVKDHNLESRINLIHSNALESDEEFNNIDTVMSFMCMHDLFDIYGSNQAAKNIAESFSYPKYIWVADTFSSQITAHSELPIFTNGFEMIHHMQNIQLFQKKEYLSSFQSAGYDLLELQSMNIPSTYMMIFKRKEL